MKKYTQLQRLRKKPRISHLNAWYNRPFIEWISGRRDGKRFQICDLEGGHTTPYIHRKSHFLDTYITNCTEMSQENLTRYTKRCTPFARN